MIKKLNENTIRRIAAGEVITRPAYAMKELVENAIDADADDITIHINNNGLEKLIVIDNGIGMSKNDLALCTELHTTSKTNDDDQFFGCNTLGFRGEALASIAIISDLTIYSNDHKLYNKIITNSTVINGTKVEVKNLFEKLPARLKFLKKSNVEFEFLRKMLKKIILQYENIKWTVYKDNNKLWQFDKTSRNARFVDVFNEEPVFFDKKDAMSNIRIFGCIFREHQKFQAIYVNNRVIKDAAITHYLQTILKEYFMKHEEPSYVLLLELDPVFVDYNIHPTKEAVRFFSYNEIFRLLSDIFSNDLFDILYKAEDMLNKKIQPKFLIKFNNKTKNQKVSFLREANLNLSKHFFEDKINHLNEPMIFSQNELESACYNVIGQIKNSYIIFDTTSGIGVFDQHAAHERQLYQRMKKELTRESQQKLLFPIKLNVTEEQKEYLKENISIFENKGIVMIDDEITHIPNLLNIVDFKIFFEQELRCNVSCAILIDRLFANIACKKALKANTKLSLPQMQSLLDESLQNPPMCNHGRPVFKYFSLDSIEGWFKR